MKSLTVIILAAMLAACAGQPARPRTAAEIVCDYEANRAMAGSMGASPFEAASLYHKCLAAKKAGAL